MFSEEQFATIQKEIFIKLTSDTNVTWFIDANVVISGTAAKSLTDSTRVLTTPDIVGEVQKRPECKAANNYIKMLEETSKVVTRSDFSDVINGLDLLVSCAKKLTPVIQLGREGFMQEMENSKVNAEVRAIETAANQCNFLDRPKLIDDLNQSLTSLLGAKIDIAGPNFDKTLRRAWQKYPTKRRNKHEVGYLFSDETILATALAYSIFKQKKVCVLSDDMDCLAIMKQLTDNLLWVMTAEEFKLQHKEIHQDAFVQRFGEWCQYVDRHRQDVALESAMQSLDDDTGESSETIFFAPNELKVCRPTNSVVSSYSFPEEVVEFIRSFRGNATWPGIDCD